MKARPYTYASMPKLTGVQVALEQSVRHCLSANVLSPSFLHDMGQALAVDLRDTELEITPPDLSMRPGKNILTNSADMCTFAVLGIGTNDEKILCELDPVLCGVIIERLLGGEGASIRPMRHLTDVETGVLSYLCLRAIDQTKVHLDQGTELPLVLERIVTDKKELSGLIMPSDIYACLGLKLQVAGHLGYVRVVLPPKLMQQRFGKTIAQSHATQAEQAHMRKMLSCLPELTVGVRIMGARLELTASDVANVEVGDIIILDNHRLERSQEGLKGHVTLLFGRGKNAVVEAELVPEVGEAHLKISAIKAMEDLAGDSVDENLETTTEADNLGETEAILRDVDSQVAVEIGRLRLNTAQIVRLKVGQVLKLSRTGHDPVDLVLGNKLFARGELVEVDGELGVRLVQVKAD